MADINFLTPFEDVHEITRAGAAGTENAAGPARLIVEAYTDNHPGGELYPSDIYESEPCLRQVIPLDERAFCDDPVELTLELVPRAYLLLAWADYQDAETGNELHYTADRLHNVCFCGTYRGNAETKDAFAANKRIDLSRYRGQRNAVVEERITLDRPLARYEIITRDVAEFRRQRAAEARTGVVDMDEGFGFVIADIPGLIEGASEGIGLGHEFLRHIERTKVMIHMVDAAGTEGRDPVADIKAINKELEAYNPQLLKKPQVIAANKIDAIAGDENEVISALRAEFEPQGIKVFPISAVSGKGLKELLYEVKNLLANCPKEVTVYEPEIDPALSFFKDEPYAVEVAADGAYEISGPKIEKMLGYTNMDSEKGFAFFQRFLREQGIIKDLENMGIEDGDTVRMYDFEFDYYK